MIEIALLIAGVLLAGVISGYLSAGGSGLQNCHLAELKLASHEDRPGAATALEVADQATELIYTLRVGNGLMRLAAVLLSFAAYYQWSLISGRFDFWVALLAISISWLGIFFIGFLGESLGRRDPLRTAMRLGGFVALLKVLFLPSVWLVLRLTETVARSREGVLLPLVTEEQIMTMVDAGEEGGVIEEDEREMIYSIFQLGDTLAREVMVPRIDVLAFEVTTSLIEITDVLLRTGYSRAPVFTGSIDNVVGLIYVKDLLGAWRKGEQDAPIKDLLRDVYFVPEAKKVDDLLTEMQARRVHLAVVIDEYGGVAGVVTFEDLMEEIVGEVRDEYDTAEEMPYQKLGDGEYLFRGRIDLDDVNQITGVQLSKESGETLGGYIYGQLGRVPVVGDSVEGGGLRMVVEQVLGRRIRKVRLVVLPVEKSLAEKDNEKKHDAT